MSVAGAPGFEPHDYMITIIQVPGEAFLLPKKIEVSSELTSF